MGVTISREKKLEITIRVKCWGCVRVTNILN